MFKHEKYQLLQKALRKVIFHWESTWATFLWTNVVFKAQTKKLDLNEYSLRTCGLAQIWDSMKFYSSTPWSSKKGEDEMIAGAPHRYGVMEGQGHRPEKGSIVKRKKWKPRGRKTEWEISVIIAETSATKTSWRDMSQAPETSLTFYRQKHFLKWGIIRLDEYIYSKSNEKEKKVENCPTTFWCSKPAPASMSHKHLNWGLKGTWTKRTPFCSEPFTVLNVKVSLPLAYSLLPK